MKQTLLSEFESVIVELREVLDKLLQSLQEERIAIIEYDVEGISKSHQNKSKYLMRMQTLGKSRNDILHRLQKEMGLSPETGIKEILENYGDQIQSDRILHQVSCVKSLAQAAEEFNESQRRYLSHTLSKVQANLSLLESLQGKGVYTASYNQSGMVSEGRSSTVSSSF